MFTAGVVFAGAALASPTLLQPGHAYCFYWTAEQGHNGGMHLVASGNTTIGAGPKNYISGLDGKPQDTVVFVSCDAVAGQAGGFAYVGMPRIALHLSGGNYTFAEHEVVTGVRHLESPVTATMTVSVLLTGTSGPNGANQISGTLRLTAPTCLTRPLVMQYQGT